MKNNAKHGIFRARRVLAGLLCAALLCGLLPAVSPLLGVASAASWAQKYVDTLAEWGVMQGAGGDLAPDRTITRAELVTLINRAYGYTDTGPIPFTDVRYTDWFYDDIRIAYTAGYLEGNGNRAMPRDNVTKEQAVVMLARNMMLKNKSGEVTAFSDGRSFSSWSRNLIQPALEAGFIEGNSDGTFAPGRNITRGEVACMLVKAIGTPVTTPGAHTLGNVYGNVTVTTSGVTLRDTTIAGDLYLTGGVGRGDILLENVTVLGRIVDSGTGESERGQSSVLLRNVVADEMIVDNIKNQFVTLRAEGNTLVDEVSVRTGAYVDDATAANMGLRRITLDAESGTQLQLAGNVKEVVNRTPQSSLVFAQGLANLVTVDEGAPNSTVTINNGASVGKLNLDIATQVGGEGDINDLTVSSNGSVVTMLPDKITVRPGVTADISGENMNNVTAAESSADPRLLSGYPAVRDVSPNSAVAVFSTNKQGTVYWAITGTADGSAKEEDVISPPSYGSTIIASGSLDASVSQEEYTANLTRLTSDGNYYLTAVMVDGRGQHSPLKVTAFSTPDDTTPAFNSGYPVMTQITDRSAQVTVMANKSCQLYYALLPKGSAQPTPADFKAAAVTGNLGYGSVSVSKNTTMPINVNDVDLDELTSYDLYLWLTDYNGAKSSAVRRLTFSTVDGTPPVVTIIRQTGSANTSATISYSVSEPCTLYWAVVKEGERFIQPLVYGQEPPKLTELAAKSQVEAGVGAVRSGSSNAARAETEYRFNITGLTAETVYDLYYVAKDRAGNYSFSVLKYTPVKTQDSNAPSVTQSFNRYVEPNNKEPYANTDVRLEFSESVKGMKLVAGEWEDVPLRELYLKVQQVGNDQTAASEARNALAAELRNFITLEEISATDGTHEVPERTATGVIDPETEKATTKDWVIDYRFATVTLEDGKTVITFPTNNDESKSALNLSSGSEYRFTVAGIADITGNRMGITPLESFKTIFATVNLTNGPDDNGSDVEFDMSFTARPASSMSNVPSDMRWDILLWSEKEVTFELYRKIGDNGAWEKAQREGGILPNAVEKRLGVSVESLFATGTGTGGTPTRSDLFRDDDTTLLKNFDQPIEYGIVLTSIGGNPVRETWSESVNIDVNVVAGGRDILREMSQNVSPANFAAQKRAGMREIQSPTEFTRPFTIGDTQPPAFSGGYPTFNAGSSTVNIQVQLSRPNTYYFYVVAPLGDIPTEYFFDGANAGTTSYAEVTKDNWDKLPTSGSNATQTDEHYFDTHYARQPVNTRVMNPSFQNNPNVKTGSGYYTGVTENFNVPDLAANPGLTGLKSNTEYIAYFVVRGQSQTEQNYSETFCFRFKTTKPTVPYVTVDAISPDAEMKASENAQLAYAIVDYNSLPSWLTQGFTKENVSDPGAKYPFDATDTPTVLDALETHVTDGRSVFDIWASDTLKQNLMAYIRGGRQTGTSYQPLNRWPDQRVNANQSVLGEFGSWVKTPGTEYVVLACARHEYANLNNALEYGFGVARGLSVKNPNPPVYDGATLIQATITEVKNGGNTVPYATQRDGDTVKQWGWSDPANPEIGGYTYKGSVTVKFSDPVYVVLNNVRYEVWAVPEGYKDGSGKDIPSNAKSVLQLLGGSATVTMGRTFAGVTDTFTFNFDSLSMNQTLTLFARGYISNSDSVYDPTRRSLSLTFDPTIQNKQYSPDYLITLNMPGFRANWG